MPRRLPLLALATVVLAAPPVQAQRDAEDKPLGHYLHLLKYGSDGEKIEAVDALERFGPQAKEAVPLLVARLASQDRDTRWQTARALGHIGGAAKVAVPALLELFAQPGADAYARAFPQRGVTAYAVEPLYAIGPEAAPALIAGLGHKQAGVRVAAARVLGYLRPRVKAAVPALQKALDDEDEYVRLFAAQSLWLLDRPAAEVVPTLAKVLASKDRDLRWRAAWLLERIGPEAEAATADLTALFSESEPAGIVAALTALARIGPGAKAAVPALLREVDERSHHGWSGHLVETLAAIGPETLPPLFETLCKKPPWPDESWRGTNLVDLVVPCYGPAALPFLSKKLQAGRADERLVAALALGATPDTAPALRKALKDPDVLVRYGAAISLGKLGARDKNLLPIALAGLRQCPDSRVEGLLLLMRLGEQHPAAVDALADYLDDPDAGQLVVRLLYMLGPKAAPVAARAGRMLKDVYYAAWIVAQAQPGDQAAATVLREALEGRTGDRNVRTILLQALAAVDPVSDATLTAVGKLLATDCSAACNYLANLGPRAAPAVPQLIVLVQRDQDREAMQALAAIGPDAAPALQTLHTVARHGTDVGKCGAILAIAAIAPGDESTLLLLAEMAATEPDFAVRQAAVRVLAGMGRLATVPAALRDRLGSPDAHERLWAAIAVAAIEKRLDTALPVLAALLDHPEESFRGLLLMSLDDVAGPAAVPLLEKALGDSSREVRGWALYRLGKLGPPAREGLRRALKHSDASTRVRAAELLAYDAGEHAAVARALQPLLSDPEHQRYALEILSAQRIADPGLEVDLVRLLGHVNASVRLHAAWLLGQQRRLGRSAVAALKAALADPQSRVRATAADALVRTAPQTAAEAAPAVVAALLAERYAGPCAQGDWRWATDARPWSDSSATVVRLGPAALPTLMELLTDRATDNPEELRRLVTLILATRGGKVAAPAMWR
jgi:HEAT repeat protein